MTLLPKVGEKWDNAGTIYRIQRVGKTWVALYNETDKRDASQTYPLTSFQAQSWKRISFSPDDEPKECPECGKEKAFHPNDFVCRDCRDAMPLTCKLVAEVRSDETIVTLEGLPQRITIRNSEGDVIVLERDNMPELALKSLKQFLEYDDSED